MTTPSPSLSLRCRKYSPLAFALVLTAAFSFTAGMLWSTDLAGCGSTLSPVAVSEAAADSTPASADGASEPVPLTEAPEGTDGQDDPAPAAAPVAAAAVKPGQCPSGLRWLGMPPTAPAYAKRPVASRARLQCFRDMAAASGADRLALSVVGDSLTRDVVWDLMLTWPEPAAVPPSKHLSLSFRLPLGPVARPLDPDLLRNPRFNEQGKCSLPEHSRANFSSFVKWLQKKSIAPSTTMWIRGAFRWDSGAVSATPHDPALQRVIDGIESARPGSMFAQGLLNKPVVHAHAALPRLTLVSRGLWDAMNLGKPPTRLHLGAMLIVRDFFRRAAAQQTASAGSSPPSPPQRVRETAGAASDLRSPASSSRPADDGNIATTRHNGDADRRGTNDKRGEVRREGQRWCSFIDAAGIRRRRFVEYFVSVSFAFGAPRTDPTGCDKSGPANTNIRGWPVCPTNSTPLDRDVFGWIDHRDTVCATVRYRYAVDECEFRRSVDQDVASGSTHYTKPEYTRGRSTGLCDAGYVMAAGVLLSNTHKLVKHRLLRNVEVAASLHLYTRMCMLHSERAAAWKNPDARCVRFPCTGIDLDRVAPGSRGFDLMMLQLCRWPRAWPVCALNLGARVLAGAPDEAAFQQRFANITGISESFAARMCTSNATSGDDEESRELRRLQRNWGALRKAAKGRPAPNAAPLRCNDPTTQAFLNHCEFGGFVW